MPLPTPWPPVTVVYSAGQSHEWPRVRFAKRCPLLHCALLRQGRSRLLLPRQVTEPVRPALQDAVLEQPDLCLSMFPPGPVQGQRNVGFLGKEGQEAG